MAMQNAVDRDTLVQLEDFFRKHDSDVKQLHQADAQNTLHRSSPAGKRSALDVRFQPSPSPSMDPTTTSLLPRLPNYLDPAASVANCLPGTSNISPYEPPSIPQPMPHSGVHGSGFVHQPPQLPQPPRLSRPLHNASLMTSTSSANGSPHSKRSKRAGSANTDGRSSQGSNPRMQGHSEHSRSVGSASADGFARSRSRVQWAVNNNDTWHRVFDQDMNELPQPGFRVEIDKGFKPSPHDDSFICQKKNHFQVTVAMKLQAPVHYVATREGLLQVSSLFIEMYGVKVESQSDRISLEQSQTDRSKRKFEPVAVQAGANEVVKVTIGRLHFSETTANNMRKKGKPNPDQRYFSLVVSLVARAGDTLYTVASHRSEHLVVRASNPGQFEPDLNAQWQRGQSPHSIIHSGHVGINVDCPDEALCIQGNLRMSGAILQPSDQRVKTNICPADTRQQLANIQALPLHHYQLTEAWAKTVGRSATQPQFGVLAQELQRVLPEAVSVSSDVKLADASEVKDLLVIDKERLFMEAVGAVQELAKQNQALQARMRWLETLVTSGHRGPQVQM